MRRIARRAGIDKRVGPHTLRHAVITAALDAGVPLRDMQEAASHADPAPGSRRSGLVAGRAGSGRFDRDAAGPAPAHVRGGDAASTTRTRAERPLS